MTKMTDAFKKVFLGLGGNPKELAENNDVGDYIVDLESAIKEYVGDKTEDIIDDSEASETTVYSSSKVESLIPTNELPTPASTNVGKVATVVSDGEGGYEWSAETPSTPADIAVYFGDMGGTIQVEFQPGITRTDAVKETNLNKIKLQFQYMPSDYSFNLNAYLLPKSFNSKYMYFEGIGFTGLPGNKYYNITVKLGVAAADDACTVTEIT